MQRVDRPVEVEIDVFVDEHVAEARQPFEVADELGRELGQCAE